MVYKEAIQEITMAKEEKSILFKDLSARLPYHPILNWKFIDNTSKDEELKELSDLYIWWITKAQDCEIKPYLRPMSSMTEEEKKELKELHFYYTDGHIVNDEDKDFKPIIVDEVHCFCIIDWLNAHHFDYCGLIDKGLAIEALEGMYNLKKK